MKVIPLNGKEKFASIERAFELLRILKYQMNKKIQKLNVENY